MLNNVTIKTRLVAVLAILSLTMMVIGVAGIASLSNSNASLKTVYEDRLVALGQLQDVIRTINRNQLNIAKAVSDDPAKLPDMVKTVEEGRAKATKVWKEYAATYLTDEEKVLVERFAAARTAFLDDGLNPALDAARAGDVQRVSTLLHGRLNERYVAMREIMNQLIQLQMDVGKNEYESSQASYAKFRLAVIGLLLGGLALAVVAGWWLVRSITQPLNRAVRIAEGVAAGDLTQQIEVQSQDETGKLLAALREMNNSLVGIVGDVRHATDSIATASSEIASGNLDLSSRTEEQASSLEETASSMEELTSTVRQNADNAKQANQLAGNASEVARRGGAVVSQVVDKMSAINESAYKIVEIIAVIDGIAFQTNILALNAAVEAARAGEQGRGFAVVASEVRNLAQRSASAAKEIKQLIDNSVAQVEEGSRLVDQAGATMQEVVDSVQQVTDIIGEISAASGEQSAGIEQINEAVVQMDNVTQQNAALVEQAAAAAGSLQEQAASLSQAVSVFRLAASAHAPAPGPGKPRAQVAAPLRSPASVTRLQPRSAAKPAAPVTKRPAAAAGNDGWEEF
ncbi:methyl-accepting chemotaxis sensory transducer with TarH sensor [Duganella sp. CF458]|uniref:methyl-accepting chemotaxis protein n=1 Tax=Duganella sp. CF458 TaxID=1884368 RepID=UPI0008DF5662|nr:methyl-accepting chemotaxis protein [Duganella sp. CF458]SFG59451.1 methyl-accepting chemotaxis sensory transducer with TarH sensor [Duganella sp. CF458]